MSLTNDETVSDDTVSDDTVTDDSVTDDTVTDDTVTDDTVTDVSVVFRGQGSESISVLFFQECDVKYWTQLIEII